MSHAEVDRDRMRLRAGSGFLCVTELADTLVREEGISFLKAHHLVGTAVRTVGREHSPEALVSALKGLAPKMLGRELGMPREIWMRALDPDHFVSVRKVPGGPALEAIQAQLATTRREQAETQEWCTAKRALLERYPQLVRVDIGALNH